MEFHGNSWKFMEMRHFGNHSHSAIFAFHWQAIHVWSVISRGIYDSVEADKEPLPGPWEELLADVIVGEPGQPSLAISQFAIENGT